AARQTVLRLVERVKAEAVAVGNGTHGRETEAFVRETLAGAVQRPVVVVSVNEAGASVYSASEEARAELGEVDVVVRGAVSIGRRLQDPLAELVKIDPASIGVGQYQHDVPAALLASKLDEVVEDCVNGVGVALNNASAPLLARVAGLGPKQARAIVAHRDKQGRFSSRHELSKVRGVGPKSFEQAAGFLRIRGGSQPLDASAVHPERYRLVETMARDLGVAVRELVGNAAAVKQLDRRRYLEGDVGAYTLDDILAELVKPGRDPRARFEPPAFRDDVRTLDDLREGMILEGVVTNVTNFGAFVDLGVKQDGLVHISQLADRFVKHPSDVVSVGSTLKVRVLSVDHERKRISLSAKGV
ncbi:MAG: helix-hairpin-helix domain-containing protein, partial [Deltaproteobacteria bacterium]|nr:helix-hairpin-helix domain-containing protein [Deltaproteobacteria bacterium]